MDCHVRREGLCHERRRCRQLWFAQFTSRRRGEATMNDSSRGIVSRLFGFFLSMQDLWNLGARRQ